MQPAASPRRRLPVWAWILISVAAVGVLCVGAVVALGVIGYGVFATSESSEQESDAELTANDPAGGRACDQLDTWLVLKVGDWPTIEAEAGRASTEGIRRAADPRALFDACVEAGANMSEWREPPR